MSSELLNIDDPLLPRLREAALRNDEAHRWLLESARRWARGEFFRREERREAATGSDYQERLRWGVQGDGLRTDKLYVEERLHSLAYKQVAVLVRKPKFAGAITTIERIKVGLLLPDSNDEYLKMLVTRAEAFGAVLSIYDIIELAPQFRTRKWPTTDDLPPTMRLEAERRRTPLVIGGVSDSFTISDGVVIGGVPVIRSPGDSITITETVTFG